jgi:hypothetical protein
VNYTLQPGYEWADVLVVVKTYPAPSARHGETVCVAGVRLDGPDSPTWIRLYPISFRALESNGQFKKYQRVRIPVRARGSYDPRPESYSPLLAGLTTGEWYDTRRNWQLRKELMGPLIGATTTCELIGRNREATMDQSVPSLGMVRATVSAVEVEEGAPWTPAQLAKARAFSAADLLNQDGYPELQPVPYQIKINYRCDEPSCRGHAPHLIDWELGAMGLTWPAKYGRSTASVIRGRYEELLDNTKKDVHLIVGNQHQRRQIFSACGVWWPKLT